MCACALQVGRSHWEEAVQHLRGFAFHFYLFKLFYLACLFKNFRTEAGLYTQPPPPDLSEWEEGGREGGKEGGRKGGREDV